jgi:hypothetical protein
MNSIAIGRSERAAISQLGDEHRRAHVEHQGLPVTADRPGLDDQVAPPPSTVMKKRSRRVGNGEQTAPLDLILEHGQH